MSTLIIEHCHLISGHSGGEHVPSLLRERFRIVKASSAIRRVLSKCVSCRRRQRPVCEQKMADLPVDRLTPDQPPFTSVGVGYFGPFQVKRRRSLVKRYGVIFTCLAIRAVHIEVSYSLDTDFFLLALRRFIARRGQVKGIGATNATRAIQKRRTAVTPQMEASAVFGRYLLEKMVKGVPAVTSRQTEMATTTQEFIRWGCRPGFCREFPS